MAPLFLVCLSALPVSRAVPVNRSQLTRRMCCFHVLSPLQLWSDILLKTVRVFETLISLVWHRTVCSVLLHVSTSLLFKYIFKYRTGDVYWYYLHICLLPALFSYSHSPVLFRAAFHVGVDVAVPSHWAPVGLDWKPLFTVGKQKRSVALCLTDCCREEQWVGLPSHSSHLYLLQVTAQ